MILILTGNGKGKTTSALGTAIRASGSQKSVAWVAFDKSESHSGEDHIFKLLQEKIDWFKFGKKRFDPKTQTFRFGNTPEDFLEADKALQKTRELLAQKYFLIVADELMSALNTGLLKAPDIRKLIDACPESTHLMLTGRNAPDWLIKKADLVSEIRDVKHYYPKIKKAIEGLDY